MTWVDLKFAWLSPEELWADAEEAGVSHEVIVELGAAWQLARRLPVPPPSQAGQLASSDTEAAESIRELWSRSFEHEGDCCMREFSLLAPHIQSAPEVEFFF